jgi:hypothetical protein
MDAEKFQQMIPSRPERFGDGISIEDTMNVLVKYTNGVQMSYSLNVYSPWEGYRVMFFGTKGYDH